MAICVELPRPLSRKKKLKMRRSWTGTVPCCQLATSSTASAAETHGDAKSATHRAGEDAESALTGFRVPLAPAGGALRSVAYLDATN